jgi:hypothetical protein
MDPPSEVKPGDPPFALTLEPSASLPQLVDNPFRAENLSDQISLSVYNGPATMVSRKPRPVTT